MPNGLFQPYQLDKSMYHFRGTWFNILRYCCTLCANSIDPDQTPRLAASDHGLHCLHCLFMGHLAFLG